MERKKWIHCFEDLSLILYVCDLSSYCYGLYEDDSCNALEENINLFRELSGNKFFQHTSFYVIFNKWDCFETLIPHVPLETYFPDFVDDAARAGSDSSVLVDRAFKFIRRRFLDVYFQIRPTDILFSAATTLIQPELQLRHASVHCLHSTAQGQQTGPTQLPSSPRQGDLQEVPRGVPVTSAVPDQVTLSNLVPLLPCLPEPLVQLIAMYIPPEFWSLTLLRHMLANRNLAVTGPIQLKDIGRSCQRWHYPRATWQQGMTH